MTFTMGEATYEWIVPTLNPVTNKVTFTLTPPEVYSFVGDYSINVEMDLPNEYSTTKADAFAF